LAGGGGSRDIVRLPGRVHWDLEAGLGALYVRLRADCCTEQALVLEFRPGWRQWSLQLQPGESHWPAEILAGLGTPWNTVQLRGNLNVSTTGLRVASVLQRVQVEGAMTLDAARLSSRLSTLRPLGSYRLQLQGGEAARLELRTLQGSLQLQGQGQWTAGRLHFEGTASADAAHEAELSNLLNIMGRRDGARSVITLG
jgi:general secretion pathway protein N